MKKVQLGRSDVYVTPVTFGAWAIGGWMWGGADEKDAIEALETSLDLGISSIDTAPVYGFGQSEELVGKAIRGKRDKVEILTKYGLKWQGEQGEFYFDTVHNDGRPVKIYKYASRDSVIAECEDSLRRLNTDFIDLFQIHWPDATTRLNDSLNREKSGQQAYATMMLRWPERPMKTSGWHPTRYPTAWCAGILRKTWYPGAGKRMYRSWHTARCSGAC
jgi:aryl-alcohol dehydrogenase-like predicted oxidoreductase